MRDLGKGIRNHGFRFMDYGLLTIDYGLWIRDKKDRGWVIL